MWAVFLYVVEDQEGIVLPYLRHVALDVACVCHVYGAYRIALNVLRIVKVIGPLRNSSEYSKKSKGCAQNLKNIQKKIFKNIPRPL